MAYPPAPWAYGGRLARSTALGARARFTVTGDEVGIVATRGPSHGKANEYVDGAFVEGLDLYSARRRARMTVFRQSFATASPHVIKVEVLHRKNRNATGHAVDIDAFSVLDSLSS